MYETAHHLIWKQASLLFLWCCGVVWRLRTINTSAPSLGSEEEFNSQKNSFLQKYKITNYWMCTESLCIKIQHRQLSQG